MRKKLVEATAKVDGKRVPLGIMNTDQALEMAPKNGMKFSHPDGVPGETDQVLTREELEAVVDQTN